MKFLKFLIISSIYVFILTRYLVNDGNNDLWGIIFDSFGINCLSAVYFLFLLIACKTTLPDGFHRIRGFEKSGRLYRIAGVKAFKFLLAKNPLPSFTGKFSIKCHSIECLYKLEKQMRNSETLHFQAFITTLILMIPFTILRDSRFLYYIPAFNILVNLYPALVQRYNRDRIDKILRNNM